MTRAYRDSTGAIHLKTDECDTCIADPTSGDWPKVLEGLIIESYVPPPPPTAQELRQTAYRIRVDDWTAAVTRYTILLELLPDDAGHATRRAKIQAKLTAAKAEILRLTDEIEAANPD